MLVESTALLQARLGLAAAVELGKDATNFVIEWRDEGLHAYGIRELEGLKKRHHLTTAFAFEPDFTAAAGWLS